MTDLRRFDLNLLLVFEALMRERSVTNAAAQLGVGQPAMSYSLSQLRAQLSDELFVRVGSGMQPTPRALELAEPIARILADIRSSVLSQRVFDPEVENRTFRIAASDQTQTVLIPELLTDLRTGAPGIQLVFRTVDRDGVGALLESGMIDVAIGNFGEPTAMQRSELLFREELVCLFDPAACGKTSPLSLDDYCELPHLIMSLRGEPSGQVDEKLAALGRERFVVIASSNFLVLPYVLHGVAAVAAVPRLVAQYCADAVGLAVSPLPVEVSAYDVTMLWHLRTDRDPAHRWLRDRLRGASGSKR
ncbi:LysR family transcriptional regulator [Bradyrhizobium genosp. P]|uniref:LysR family transcriptional regulator n=1 Tax=Bradyrhizobium genosp. P TaxID=83641 RepID=UPI003CE66FBE